MCMEEVVSILWLKKRLIMHEDKEMLASLSCTQMIEHMVSKFCNHLQGNNILILSIKVAAFFLVCMIPYNMFTLVYI